MHSALTCRRRSGYAIGAWLPAIQYTVFDQAKFYWLNRIGGGAHRATMTCASCHDAAHHVLHDGPLPLTMHWCDRTGAATELSILASFVIGAISRQVLCTAPLYSPHCVPPPPADGAGTGPP